MDRTAHRTPDGALYYIPDHDQSLRRVSTTIKEIISTKEKSFIFVLDSINFFEFRDHFSPRVNECSLEPLCSVLPTGTYPALSTVMFDSDLNEHGMYGIAFYVPTLGGIYHPSKDALVDSLGRPSIRAEYEPKGRSILHTANHDCFYVHIEQPWDDKIIWQRMFEPAKRIGVTRLTTKESGIEDYQNELLGVLAKAANLAESPEPRTIVVSLDFDRVFHKFGVKTTDSQSLMELIAEKVSTLLANHQNYAYVFFSDHGQIDLAETHEMNLSGILPHCYADRGGLGRTLYFYTKKIELVRKLLVEEVGNSGLVYNRADNRLSEVFGFDVSRVQEIGDLVTIGIRPSFPSFGWSFKAEHGGLSKEEIFVPLALGGQRSPQ
jgi:Type I phosphodiesterase / nucleotide pyrophosphatase